MGPYPLKNHKNRGFLSNSDLDPLKITVKKSIAEIAEINKEANPNIKWEWIKGTIRNETIKYATYKKKETNKQEKKLTNEINELQNKISESTEANVIEVLKNDLNEKKEHI